MSDKDGFTLTRMFHPSHRVPSLDDAEDFYRRVFGRSSTRLSAIAFFVSTIASSRDFFASSGLLSIRLLAA